MTKSEAMAYLVDSVETDGYVTKVNNFLLGNKIKFNQRQFDALVTLVYNCGTGILPTIVILLICLLIIHIQVQVPTQLRLRPNCKSFIEKVCI